VKILIAIGVPGQQEAGAAGVVLNHARELERRGHSVNCWFLDDILTKPEVAKRFAALHFAISVARRIMREKANYDVVNIHAPSGCVYGVWRKAFHPAGAPPYVMTMHGSEERYVHAMRRENRKGRASNFGWKNRLWHRLYHQTMYDFSIKTADHGAVVNREAWICTQLKYDKDPESIRFVPNGTEERYFVRRDYQDKSELRLLFVGSWLDRKGVHYLTEAFQSLVGKLAGVRLTVAGCSLAEEEIRKSFAPSTQDRLAVLPFVPRDKMPLLYAEHDVFIFPSLVEGMPLTLLEAMASGMPVVTTETCGMADVVEDGVNGLLVPPADSKRLAEAVERTCRSADLRKHLGQAAQTTMRRYTWERVVEKLEAVLHQASEIRATR